MSTTDETAIELSKMKIIRLVLLSLVFVGVGSVLYSLSDEAIRARHLFNKPALVRGVGIVTVVFFGVCAILGSTKVFDKRPGLVFSSLGVLDNASSLSAGLVPWSEIAGAEIYEISNQKMLIVKLNKPQEFIERENLIKQILSSMNHRMCGSPIAIPSSTLKIGFPELLSTFNRYHEKYATR